MASVWDEMKVNEGLVFDKRTWNLPVLAKSMMDWIKYSGNVITLCDMEKYHHNRYISMGIELTSVVGI